MNYNKNMSQPPKWINKLLQWRLPAEQFEEVQGDMQELYGQWVEEVGERKANKMYALNAFTFLRPLPKKAGSFQTKTNHYLQANFFDMFSNHLTLAFRNLLRNKAHSLINISGLALGIACCLMVFLILRYELSFDSFHSKADRIYRVNTKFITTGGFSGGAPLAVGEALKRDFPEIEQATTINFANERLLKVGEQLRKQKGVVYAASEYFTILDAKWLSGNPRTALAEPNSVVLTKTTALNLFGGEDNTIAQLAIGKTLLYEAAHTLKVTGVVEDFPSNTDLPFELFISYISLKTHAPYLNFNDWISFSGNYTHFVLLREGANPADLQRKIPAFEKKHMGNVEAGRRTHLLQPLREMHFDSRFGNHSGRVVSKENIGGLILIGLFILLTACINFINLSTAQSIKRSKEVGVRKVLGANRMGLVRQFLAETSLLTFASTILAAIITALVLPGFKELLGLQLSFTPFSDPALLLFLALITLFVSVLAGIYPAFILSGFQPIMALKNKLSAPRSHAFSLRRSLIVLQFTIAQVLIICTLVVSSQLEYFRSKPLGFAKDAIITIGFPSENKPETSRALRNELQQLPGVENVSYAVYAPSSESSMWSTFTFKGADPTQEYYIQEFLIDHTYLETYDLTLLAGKNLDENTDSSKILVNEKLLQTLDITNPEQAIGYTYTGMVRTGKLQV
jgi:putative ABC transport system permease protein